MMELLLHLDGTVRKLEAQAGENLLQVLRRSGIFAPDAPCGGRGLCGKCSIGLGPRQGIETVMACRTAAAQGQELWLESPGEMEVLAESSPAAAGAGTNPLGIVVDLGTTTLALALYDLTTGDCLRSLGTANAQWSFGADVISRIEAGKQDGFTQASRVLREQVAQLTAELASDSGRIHRYVVTGNTVMLHFYAGLSPESIASAPFAPKSHFGELYSVKDFGLPGTKGASVVLPPVLSGYLGGDVTCGLLWAEREKVELPALFLDIGTNGEMALLTEGEILCCAAAAGPAFEGAGISRGMPALPGAICRVNVQEGTLRCETVGGGPSKGICGSGLLDGAACLLELGVLEESGRLACGAVPLTPEVSLTQQDIRALQLAKGAIAGGISTLLHRAGLSAGEVKRVLMAGGFGNTLNPGSAGKIGMIPAALVNRTRAVGNTALRGAAELLLCPESQQRVKELAQRCKVVELSGDVWFSEAFFEAMAFEEW